MRTSTTLILLSSLLVLSGVFDRIFRSAGVSKYRIAFLLLCLLAAGRFDIRLTREAELYLPCPLFFIALYCAALYRQRGRGAAAIPLALIGAAFGACLPGEDRGTAIYAIALCAALTATLSKSLLTSTVAAALAPPASAAISFVFDPVGEGISQLVIGEEVLAAQLAAVLCVWTLYSAVTHKNNTFGRMTDSAQPNGR